MDKLSQYIRQYMERLTKLEKSVYGEQAQEYFRSELSKINSSYTDEVEVAYNYRKEDKLNSCV